MNNSFKIQGIVEIEKINKKDRTKTVYKNTITKGGKQFLLNRAANSLIGIDASTYGEILSSNMLTKTGSNYVADYRTARCARNVRTDRDINNVLLNLGEGELDNLSEDTRHVDIWDATMSLKSKLVGYASSNLNPTNDGKEGLVDVERPEYVADAFTIAKRWKYDAGVASGTINVVGMMPGSSLQGVNGEGLKNSKCIDRCNVQSVNFSSLSSSFLIPGVAGYTNNNEILLNYTTDNNSKWKYNIATGETVKVEDTENFWVVPAGSGDTNIDNLTDMRVIGGYLYCVYSRYSYRYVIIDVYDISNNMNKVTSIQCDCNSNGGYHEKASLVVTGSNVYVSCTGYYDVSTHNYQNYLFRLTKSGSNNYYSNSVALTSYADIDLVVPDGIKAKTFSLSNYGDNYILCLPVELYDNISDSKRLLNNYSNAKNETGFKSVGIVFSSLGDFRNTIIDIIPGITPNEILFSAGSNKGSLRIGFDSKNKLVDINRNYPAQNGYTYDMIDCSRIIMNNDSKTNVETVTLDLLSKGCMLTLDGWWTSIFSFVKLSEAITKTDDDILYVSYGYKIV